jgi:sucrose-6F-phosphate phosphohydrolase
MASSAPDPPSIREAIVVSDLDWTMVNHNHGDHHTDLKAFNKVWEASFASNRRSQLIFSSGRSPELYEQLANEVPLLKPDVLVCSVGTEMIFLRDPSQHEIHDAWEAWLNGEGWDRDVVERQVEEVRGVYADLSVSKQQDSEQRPHKVSYKVGGGDVDAFTRALAERLSAEHGMNVNVIYSGGQDLDILPARASKGKALRFLLDRMPDHPPVLVCGDSGNDIELFEVEGVYGCIVGNAHVELREWYERHGRGNHKMHFCKGEGPAGIVESLAHFQLL